MKLSNTKKLELITDMIRNCNMNLLISLYVKKGLKVDKSLRNHTQRLILIKCGIFCVY